MSWPLVELSEVAPAKAFKDRGFSERDSVLQLTLDHIESNSGQLLKYYRAPVSEAGNSTHWFTNKHVLYSKLRPYLNKVYLPKETGIGTTELVPMLPDENRLDREYLAYYLRSKSFVDWVSSQTAGAKMPRVSMKVFWEHKIPLPTLAEQKRIAAILDKADAIRRKRQQAIQLADEFLRATFLDMFGDPITNPKSWPEATLEDATESLKRGPFGGSLKKEIFVPKGYAVYEQQHAINNNFSDVRYFISEEKYEEMSSFKLSEGDLIVSCSGTLGKVAIVPKLFHEGVINQALLRIRTNENFIQKYVLRDFLMSEPIQKYLFGFSHGSGLKNFPSMTVVRELAIPKYPLALQNHYLSIREKILKLKEGMLGYSDCALLSSISQKAFAGHL